MAETTGIDAQFKADVDCQAQIDYYIAEMKKLQQQMTEDREEIKALQEETRGILTHLMAELKAA